MLHLRCSTIFTPKDRIDNATIIIKGGKIIFLEKSSEMPISPHAQMIDARGMIAAPGYIDWQINGGFGHDFTADPESLWDVAARLPEYGVTAFLPTIVSAPLEVYTKALQVLKFPAGYILLQLQRGIILLRFQDEPRYVAE